MWRGCWRAPLDIRFLLPQSHLTPHLFSGQQTVMGASLSLGWMNELGAISVDSLPVPQRAAPGRVLTLCPDLYGGFAYIWLPKLRFPHSDQCKNNPKVGREAHCVGGNS